MAGSGRALVLSTLLGSLACTGEITSPGAQPAGPANDSGVTSATPAPLCGVLGTRDPGPRPVRRLTRREYDNTVRALLGDETAPASRWLADTGGLGFDNDATAQVVTRQHVEQFMLTAGEVATRAMPRVPTLAPCDLAQQTPAACAAQFVETFGQRAYRRPLQPSEKAILTRVYNYGEGRGGYATGIRYVLETVLQSEPFLYLTETGTPGAADASGRTPLTDWEIASRLSYFLWAAPPDDLLFAEAAAGRLRTAEQLKQQAQRMMKDPRTTAVVHSFFEQWLRTTGAVSAKRSPDVYPLFSEAAALSMSRGTAAFLKDVALDSPSGTFEALMTADYAFVDENSAPIWGVTLPPGTGLRRVTLPPGQRAGILTDLTVLTAHSSYAGYSPVARGVFIRENVMCDPLPMPPQNVGQVPEPAPNLTTRERFEAHRRDPSCAACHKLIDGIGMSFENYDAIGAYRREENGKTIDSGGEIVGYPDSEGTFAGAVGLGRKLADSATARHCFMTQWFRFAAGRREAAADACTLNDLYAQFEASGFRIRDLLVAITQIESFRHRRIIQTETCTP